MTSIKNLYKIGYGPSSSHTMGPAFAAKYIFKKYQKVANKVCVVLYNSLALTGNGHLTNKVLNDELSSFKTTITTKIDQNLHPNLMVFNIYHDEVLIAHHEVLSVGGGEICIDGKMQEEKTIYQQKNLSEILKYINQHKISLYEYVVKQEGDDIVSFLENVLNTMFDAVEKGLDAEGVLPGKLRVKRKAKMLYHKQITNETNLQKEKRLISAYAFAVSEQNASGGLIVTAPTCGACGIVPAVLYNLFKKGIAKDKLIEGLAVAGIIGNVIKHNASISGAVAGCQAEVGSGCCMAAAALAHIYGYNPNVVEYAAEIAMEHHLGLTCDPIAGYVQIPCIERNAMAALRAVDAADLSVLLVESAMVSFDDVVEAMFQTGLDMHANYKETALGGLAVFVKGERDDHCW